jgi:hypothetical protein
METFIDDAQVLDDMRFWMQAALFCTAYFAFLEFIEFAQSGPIDYLGNMWNVMDWINFFLFSQVYLTMTDVLNLNDRDQLAYGQPGTNCVNKLCVEFGFYDLWEVMDASRSAPRARTQTSLRCRVPRASRPSRPASRSPHVQLCSVFPRVSQWASSTCRSACASSCSRSSSSPTSSCPRCRS